MHCPAHSITPMTSVSKLFSSIVRSIKICSGLTLRAALFPLLSRLRISFSSHALNSQELTCIRQFSSCEPLSDSFMSLVARIYAGYNQFFSKYIAPSCNDNTSSWAKYPAFALGEHYALLPMIAQELNALSIIEIGTFQGCSSKSLLLNTSATIETFDIKPWYEHKPSFLSAHDFSGGRLVQHIADLSDPVLFDKYSNLLLNSDIVFIDGPKNYAFERTFLRLLFDNIDDNSRLRFLIIDDVLVSTMVDIWHSIPYPKIIFNQIGHWSGTGLVCLRNE